MQMSKKIALEDELYIYQRADVKHPNRWYCSFKLKGVKRINKSLGVMSQESAAKLARRALADAETQLDSHGTTALLGRNTIGDAVAWFNKNGGNILSETRYKAIASHWKNHLAPFFGAKTVIDKRLQEKMATYVEYRRRIINKKTGKRAKATASTIKIEIISAKQLLKLAREAGGIGSDVGNLTIGIQKKKLAQGKSRTTTFTDSEIEDIQNTFDSDALALKTQIASKIKLTRNAGNLLYQLERLRFFVALSFTTGARVNELRQVRHTDFSNDFKTLRIRKSKTRAGTNRQAYIDNEIWNIRSAYNRYLKYAKTRRPQSLVFADKEGDAEKQESHIMTNAGQSFSTFLKKHKMLYEKVHGRKRRNLLAARHYFITKMVNDGVDAFQVSQITGTSVAMIEKTYYEADADMTVHLIEKQKITNTRRQIARIA